MPEKLDLASLKSDRGEPRVIIIEQDEEKAAKADGELDAMVIRGDGGPPSKFWQRRACSRVNVDLLIGCTDHDEVNILACWIAKRVGVKRVISRVRSLEFTDTQAWAHEFEIDLMVSPERSVAGRSKNCSSCRLLLTPESSSGNRSAYMPFGSSRFAGRTTLSDVRSDIPNFDLSLSS